jgi:hypothetical protein
MKKGTHLKVDMTQILLKARVNGNKKPCFDKMLSHKAEWRQKR